MALRILRLGESQVWRDGELVRFPQERTKTLLKILLSEPGRVFSWDQLIEYLWPDMNPEQGRRLLKARASELRRLLEPSRAPRTASKYIRTHPQGYSFQLTSDCQLDSQLFQEHDRRARQFESQDQWTEAARELEAALELYRGELFEEDRYEEWALAPRERWRELHLDMLSRLAECHARLGHYRRATSCCRQILQKEPYRESVYRQLMLYHYLAGSPTEALRAYDECGDKLKELEREPARETRECHQQIQARQIPRVEKLYPPAPLIRHEIPYTLSPGSLPFVGRREEYAQLVNYLEQAHSSQGCCILISGEAGVGKTRLIQEAIAYAHKRFSAHIFAGRGHELGLQLSYQPWVEAIEANVEKLAHDDLHAISPLWLAEVAKIVPELRVRITELPENPSLPPQQEQLRFFEGLLQFFLGVIGGTTTPKPLVIFLDDLHWADTASLDLLNYLIPRIGSHPIVVLGTYRCDEVREGHPLLQLVRTWAPKNLLHLLPLPRLALQEVVELLRRLPLTVKRPDVFCARLYQETEGNPLFLILTLQHLFEEGALRVERDRWITDTDDISAHNRELMIPPTLKDLIAQRVARLSKPAEKLLQLASVIGQDFEPTLLERAWTGPEPYLTALLRLIEAQLLIDHLGRYAFTHNKIREIVYQEIGPPRRQLLHQWVMQAMEQLYSARREEWTALLAQHASRAGEWKKALEYALQAVQNSVRKYRHQETLQLAQLGAEAVEKLAAAGEDRVYLDTQQFELLAQQVEIFNLQGQREGQRRNLTQMKALAKRLGDKRKLALAFQKECDLHEAIGEYPEAEKEARKALELYQELGDRRGQADSLRSVGIANWNRGRYEEALGCYQQALQIRRELGDRQGQAFSLVHIAGVYWAMGQHQEVLRYNQRALAIYQEIGDRWGQGITLNNSGLAYNELGEYKEGLRSCQQALELQQETGNRRSEGMSLGNIAEVYHNLGQYEKALQYYQQSLDLFEEIGELRNEGISLNNMGEAYRELKRYEEALQCYQQALEISQKIGDRWCQWFSFEGVGNVYHDLGQHAKALEQHEQAQAISEETGVKVQQLACLSALVMDYFGLNELEKARTCSAQAIRLLEGGQACQYPQEIYFNHFQILLRSGADAARRYLQKAYDLVMQRAQAIEDGEARESFLTNVRLNREIVMAWNKRQ